MDKEQAYKIGLAFKLGMIYARGKAHARQLANDDAKWITVHPNGQENKGRPALLDSETGEVLGGMGGKFNGKHISIANSKSNKPALLNNQQVSTLGLKKEDDNKINEFKSTNQKPAENNQQSITNADFKKYHLPLNQLSKIEKETDKAFLISSDFASGFDGDDTVFQKKSVWVPKSQVSSKNGYVFGMNPKYAKENGFTTQRSRELAKRLRLPSLENQQNSSQTRTQNKALNTAKENGSVASVLNVPDASRWNNKIYKYRNGERAVFINNQKIVLNDAQYKKLKEFAGK